jgi:RHS repeat-associated protein
MDYLGISQLSKTWDGTVYSIEHYAPLGEAYDESGSTDRSFTGQDQDAGAGGVYDFMFRRYDSTSGRWLSPDPAGWAAVNTADPQSLDRYAYVENNPMSMIDPLGLDGNNSQCVSSDQTCVPILFQTTAWGSALPAYASLSQGCDPNSSYSCEVQLEAVQAQQSHADEISFNVGYVPSGAPSNGFGQTPVHGPWTYGNWCGAGGSGTPINSTDAACMAHDQCYDNLNLNADQYMSGNLSPSQIQGAAACNQQLCNAVLNANRNPSTPFSQRWAGAEIILFFSLTGPKGARCQGF